MNTKHAMTMLSPGGREFTVTCGAFVGGYARYCKEDQRKLEKQYPQGWHYYAGDTCRHGAYVGGSGVDWMCGACESGEE